MSTGRRVGRLEGGLSITDAVLLWVVVVQAYPSLAAYARALRDGRPGVMTPVDIGRYARAGTRTVRRRAAADPAAAATAAARDAGFLYQVVLCLNEAIIERVPVLGPHYLLAVARRDALLARPGFRRRRPPAADAVPADLSEAWQEWCDEANTVIAQIREVELTRTTVQARYFDGRSILMADVEDALEATSGAADGLERLTAARPDVLGPAPLTDGADPVDPGASIAAHARERVAELVADARAAAFGRLRETRKAAEILEARLGPADDST